MSTGHAYTGRTPSPFSELAEMYRGLRERGLHETVDGSIVQELLCAAGLIEAAYNTVAEMQLGAEGFDNTEAAGQYRRVQEHILAAARELVTASAVLKERVESWGT